MLEIIPFKKPLKAVIKAPSSKSHTLRAFFLAGLSGGKSIIIDPLLAEDQFYALSALKEFGITSQIKRNKIIIVGCGGKLKLPSKKIFIGNSGVTARFLASFAALAPQGKIIIDGNKRMREGRPIKDLIHGLRQLGVKIKSIYNNGCLPIEVEGGTLKGGACKMKGNISSQYFSSILISAPYAQRDTTIKCVGPLRSKPYIDVTIQMMNDFGVKVINKNYQEFFVRSGQRYNSRKYQIEGDYTNASYFLAAAAISGGRIKIKNLKRNSKQGDKIILNILQKMRCQINKRKEEVELLSLGKLKPIGKIDMQDFPDLVPTVAILAAFANGKTEIENIEHLRYKESDRIKALVTELAKMNIEVKEKKDGLSIVGNPERITGAKIACYNDHRIAMAFSVMGLKIPKVVILDEQCVNKSFPHFYDYLSKLV